MNKAIKLSLKIIGIIIGIIVLLIILLIILLSILFPNELVKNQIEEQVKKQYSIILTIDKLKFSVFSGIKLSNLKIYQGDNWKNDTILSIENINLGYKFFPLLSGKLKVKSAVISRGEIFLEKNKFGANWDFFLQKFAKSTSKQTAINKTKPIVAGGIDKTKKKPITQKSIPIEIDVKKIGIEKFSIEFLDSTFSKLPLTATLKDFTLLAKNISVKKNKPFDLIANIEIELKAGNVLNLFASANAKGKLRLFDDSGKLNLNGPIELEFKKGQFQSKSINKFFISSIRELLNKILGPTITAALHDPTLITKQCDKYFNAMLDKSEEKITNVIEAGKKILNQKKEAANYCNKKISTFTDLLNKKTDDITAKINKINSRISPILDTASKIPFIETMVDLNSYRKKMNDLISQAKKKKDTLISTYKSQYQTYANKELSSYFPKNFPSYETIKTKFMRKVNYYKNEVNKKLKKYSPSEFIYGFLPDMSFLEKEWTIENLHTNYYLNKESNQSQAKEFNFSTDFFDLSGEMTTKKGNINFTGEITQKLKSFKFNFLPIDSISTKASITGNIKKLKFSFLEKPSFNIEESKKKTIGKDIINSFLKKNYFENLIIKDVLGGISYNNINLDDFYKKIDNTQEKYLKNFETDKKQIMDYITNGTNNIIKEIKSNVPGL